MSKTERPNLQIDRVKSTSGNNMYAVHAHEAHELYFLISGQRRYFVGHTIYDVVPGNLVLIPKSVLHRTTSINQRGYDRFVVNFSDEDISPFPDLIGRENFDALMSGGCLQLSPEAVRQIQRNLETLEREYNEPSAYAEAIVRHLLQDILLTALLHGRSKQNYQGEIADKIQDVTLYISENYAAELTLADAAAIACMEKTYFSKRFKALTGFGFQEYLTQTRLLAVEQLLRETTLPLGEIAERCGFSGANYLGDVFRRWMGISPSEYRRKR